MGTKNKAVNMPILKVTNENNETIYSTTTEEKVKTITKSLENIFTHDTHKEHFDNN